ncbi:MAG TPA: hypothetical protein PK735_14085, partial [Flavobacteriales bacterium]|nr:hypothetical protein [Flavobacteriales bacterium]
MIKFLHRILCLSLLLAVCFNVEAQTRKVYNLETDFGLSWMQGKLQVKNIVTDTVKAKERFPVFYAYRASKGFKGAHFMELSCFDADFGEAGRQGHGGTTNAMLNSNNHIIVPSGEYWQTITAEVRGMEVHGAGPGHVAFQDNKNNVNTRLILWHEKWQGDPNERHCMQSSTWNLGKGNTYYSEGMVITGFSFQGRSNEFPTQKFNSSGLRLWFPGEVCSIDQLYCTNFRTAGIEVYGATPLNAGNVSVFDNVVAGVIFYSSGSTVNWDLLSGDDNGSMFACLNGYADTGGGSINFSTIKNETFVASQGRCHRGMRVGHIEGQFTVNIGVVSGYSGTGYTDAAFVID